MQIKDGTLSNSLDSLEYQREIFHMFANAMMYNRPGSDVYVMAEDVGSHEFLMVKCFLILFYSQMMLESEQLIENFRQTQNLQKQQGGRNR